VSDENVYVQLDNKAGNRMSLAFGIGGVTLIASGFLFLGGVLQRLDRVERDVQMKATASEIAITNAIINEKFRELSAQITQIQLTLQNNTRPNR
jgi:hypothetical protein